MSINYISKLYKSRVNLLYYMKNLGFDTSEHEEFTMEEINAKYVEGLNEENNPLNFNLIKYNEKESSEENIGQEETDEAQDSGSEEEKDIKNPMSGGVITVDKNEYVTVKYILKVRPGNIEQISNNHFTDIVDQKGGPNAKKNHTLILVVPNPPNDTMIKTLKQVWDRYQEYVVVFDIGFLQINVLKHQFVPEHRKLTNEEKEFVYKKYNIVSDKQMPEISIMDSIAKAILLRPGQICEIKRYDKISFVGYYYRICVCQ